MAISKILYMKDSGPSFHGKSLKNAIDYITDGEKTQGGRLVQGMNCLPDTAFKQMKETKKKFGKLDKRQGYHLILSFKEGEVDADTAMEITEKFVKSYLGENYEAVYAVHDNTDLIHSHIVFNSVSFQTGRKYRYEKGDWAKDIQPLMNKLCREYGLSELEFEDGKVQDFYELQEWKVKSDGRSVWSDMIKRDIDAGILQASSFESFLDLLAGKGYEIKNAPSGSSGKYLAIRPPGMNRYRRCKSLGERYSEEAIRERIGKETLSGYQSQKEKEEPRIVYCKVKRYRKTRLSGLQKRYFAKLYRTGQLKKKPYSQVWKYREDIKKMHLLQKQYLFLAHHDINSLAELTVTAQELDNEKRLISKEKSRIYRARSKYESLFAVTDQMKELLECENSFRQGDSFFQQEHEQWMGLSEQLKAEGYSYDEVEELRQYYHQKYAQVSRKEKAVYKELKAAESILKEYAVEGDVRELEKEKEKKVEKRKVEKRLER